MRKVLLKLLRYFSGPASFSVLVQTAQSFEKQRSHYLHNLYAIFISKPACYLIFIKYRLSTKCDVVAFAVSQRITFSNERRTTIDI